MTTTRDSPCLSSRPAHNRDTHRVGALRAKYFAVRCELNCDVACASDDSKWVKLRCQRMHRRCATRAFLYFENWECPMEWPVPTETSILLGSHSLGGGCHFHYCDHLTRERTKKNKLTLTKQALSKKKAHLDHHHGRTTRVSTALWRAIQAVLSMDTDPSAVFHASRLVSLSSSCDVLVFVVVIQWQSVIQH